MDKNNSNENSNQRLRIISGTIISVSVLILATTIGIFSSSQSAETIIGIVAMAFTVVLIVIFLVVMPKTITEKPRRGIFKYFHMDNPIVAIIVALLTQVVAFILGQWGVRLWSN